jgi:hypothetical protein
MGFSVRLLYMEKEPNIGGKSLDSVYEKPAEQGYGAAEDGVSL